MQMPQKRHELRVSSLGMFILLMFNEAQAAHEGLSVNQIMLALSIDEDACRKSLRALSTPKVKILALQSSAAVAQQQQVADGGGAAAQD